MSSQDRPSDSSVRDDKVDPLEEGLTAAENDEFAGPEDAFEILDESE